MPTGDECLAIGFDYDQPHRIEPDHAQDIADHYGVPFKLVGLLAMLNPKVDDVVFGGRNLILSSLAIAMAEAKGFDREVGCNASDWARFPDCRPTFWRNVERCAEAYGVGVITPLIYMSKRDVVEAARKLDVPIELTWSCYSPSVSVIPGHIGEPVPCGACLACKTREEALQ